MIAIIDYGMGNIHSVNKALHFLGAKTKVTNNPKDILRCDKAVLPGVGAFDDAIKELERQRLISAIKSFVKSKKPLLGICLGMQILFEKSEEGKTKRGLGLLKGEVKRFSRESKLKVPHIGWNNLVVRRSSFVSRECLLLKDVPDNSFVYFCHSYYPVPKEKDIVAATCSYGREFAALVCMDNVYGAQFHPEKSQTIGLKMLDNFINLC